MASLMKIYGLSRSTCRLANKSFVQRNIAKYTSNSKNNISSILSLRFSSSTQTTLTQAEVKLTAEDKPSIRMVKGLQEERVLQAARFAGSKTSSSRDVPLLPQIIENLQRWNHVEQRDVERALAQMERKGHATSQQCLTIIRCLGNLMPKLQPAKRTIFATQAWNRLLKLGVPLDITLYNAWLRIRLENKDLFSSVSVLEELASKGLTANRMTYQLLIARYCEEGDIEGAGKIFDFMKSQNMSVNEFAFNSLIKGHLRKGDNTSAVETLGTMREMGLEPSVETYKVLMCGFAEKGDIKSMLEIFEKAKKEEASLKGIHLLSVVTDLVLAGHKDKLPELLDLMKETRLYFMDVANALSVLLVHGYDDAAFAVYKLIQPIKADGHGRVLLKTMIQLERPINKVVQFHKQLTDEGQLVDDLDYFVFWALRNQSPDYNLTVLEEIKKQGEELKPHYYSPILLWYVHNNKREVEEVKEGVYKVLKHMNDNISQNKGELTHVFLDGVFPLLQLGETAASVMKSMADAGFSANEIRMLETYCLISEGKFTEAIGIAKQQHEKLSPVIIKSAIVEGAFKNKDFNGISELMLTFQTTGHGRQREAISNALLSMAKDSRFSSKELEELVTLLVNKATISKELRRQGVSDSIISKLIRISKPLERIEIMASDYKEKSLRELEALKEAQSGFNPSKTLDMVLLQRYCFAGNVEKVEELKTSLEKVGFIYNSNTLVALGSFAAVTKKDLNELLKYKEQVESQYPDSKAIIPLFLHVLTFQVKDGATLEVVNKLLHEFAVNKNLSASPPNYANNYAVNALLNECKLSWTPENMEYLLQQLYELGFTKPSVLPMNVVMACYLEKGTTETSLGALERFVRQYNEVPLYSQLFEKLIQQEDADKLQKAVSFVSSILGEMTTLHHLAFSFVMCGKTKQARKIFETPGMRALNAVLEEHLQSLSMLGKVKEVEAMISATKNLFALNKDEMLFHLIRAHCANKDYTKALDVLTIYEEENCQPTPRTLRYLAVAFKSVGLQVPFEVPEKDSKEGNNKAAMEFVNEIKSEKKDQPHQPAKKNETSNSKVRVQIHDNTAAIERALSEDLPGLMESINIADLLTLQEKNEKLFQKVAAAICESGANRKAIVNLASYYYLNNNPNEASKLLNKYPEAKDRFPVMHVCKIAHSKHKLGPIEKLIEDMANESPARFAVPLNHAIKMQCDRGNWKQALEYVTYALSKGFQALDILWMPSIVAMENLLNAHNQQIPWTPDTLKKRREHDLLVKQQRKQLKSGSSAFDENATASSANITAEESSSSKKGTFKIRVKKTSAKQTNIDEDPVLSVDTRKILSRLSSEGNVKAIEDLLKDKNMSDKVRKMMQRYLLSALVNSNNTTAIEKYLNEDLPGLMNSISIKSLRALEEKDERLFTKVATAICGSSANIYAIMDLVCCHYELGNLKEASDLLQKFPEAKKGFRLMDVCTQARHKDKLSIVENLIENYSDMPAVRLSVPLNIAILMQCDKLNIEQAVKYVTNAINKGYQVDEILWPSCLKRMEKFLTANNQQIPWTPDTYAKCKARVKQQKRLKHSSSSDSSSSDEN